MQKNYFNAQKKMNQDFSKTIINQFYSNKKFIYTENWSRAIAVIFVLFLLTSFLGAYYYVRYIDNTVRIVDLLSAFA